LYKLTYTNLPLGCIGTHLCFKIAALRPFHHDVFAEVEHASLTALGTDFTVNIANCQTFEEANLLERCKPDLFMDHLVGNQTASKLGIPTHTIYHTGLNYVGYQGAFELARRLHRQLPNPAPLIAASPSTSGCPTPINGTPPIPSITSSVLEERYACYLFQLWHARQAFYGLHEQCGLGRFVWDRVPIEFFPGGGYRPG